MCSRWVITSSAIRAVLSAYLRLLIFLQAVWIPACASSSPASSMMYCASELNKQGDNIQPWYSPFTNMTQFVIPCPFRTVASWPVYSSWRRWVWFSATLRSWRIFHGLLWSTESKALFCVVSEAEVDVSLEFPDFLWSSVCWQFDLLFICLLEIQFTIWNLLVHLLLT